MFFADQIISELSGALKPGSRGALLIRSVCFHAGNPDDKKLSPRKEAGGKLERRNSLRGSSASRRLQATLRRSGSMRHISNKNKTDECGPNGTAEPQSECPLPPPNFPPSIVSYTSYVITVMSVDFICCCCFLFPHRKIAGNFLQTLRQPPPVELQVPEVQQQRQQLLRHPVPAGRMVQQGRATPTDDVHADGNGNRTACLVDYLLSPEIRRKNVPRAPTKHSPPPQGTTVSSTKRRGRVRAPLKTATWRPIDRTRNHFLSSIIEALF